MKVLLLPAAALIGVGLLVPPSATAQVTDGAQLGAPQTTRAVSNLSVSEVYFSDVSTCDTYYYRDCAGDWSFATSWAFSVTNRSKTRTATLVKAQVRLFDSAGRELSSSIVTVAKWIPPKSTVWVAPRADSGQGVVEAGDFDVFQAGVTGVASAKAEVVSSGWAKRAPGRLPLSAQASFDITEGGTRCWDAGGRQCAKLAATAISSNRGPALNVYSTWIMRDSLGRPMGGLRFDTTRKSGSQQVGVQWRLPYGVAGQFAKITNHPAPR